MQPFKTINRIAQAGLDGLIFYFGGSNRETINKQVFAYHQGIKSQPPCWLKDVLPSFDSLLIIFDPFEVDTHRVYHFMRNLDVISQDEGINNKHRIPVWYGAPDANDLEDISSHTGLSAEQIIDVHTATRYRVYAVGFAPGFAYLGDSPERLAVPRRQTPRTKVPAGAVALADKQSAVYPQASPGGWQLLGLSPVSLFDSHADQPALLQIGDEVTFYAIDESDYRNWRH